MIAPKENSMTPQQLDWIARMRSDLETLHDRWYNTRSFGIYQDLFDDTDRKIRQAAHRMNVVVENEEELAAENEGWDGELYAPLVVLGMALDTIIATKNRCAEQTHQAARTALGNLARSYPWNRANGKGQGRY